MSRRASGVAFCFIAAMFFCAWYIVAAIYGTGAGMKGDDHFRRMLGYVGMLMPTLSVISLLIGIVYLVLAELRIGRNNDHA